MMFSFVVAFATAVSAATVDEYDLPEPLYECVAEGKPNTATTKIVYPSGDGPYHVVLYHHGADGYSDLMEDWLREMSDVGQFIIIAPKTPSCGKSACGNVPACEDLRDLYTALSQSREHRELYPVLAKADFDRVGVLGHSMGAKHAPTFIANTMEHHPDANIKALVASHGGDPNETSLSALSVPVMFTTTADDTSNDRQPQIYKAFNLAGAVHKVFARLLNGGHMEPETKGGGKLAEMTSYFMSGHVNLNDEHKARIYGTGSKTLCGGSIEFAEPGADNCVVCETSSSCPKLTPPSSRRLDVTNVLV